MVWSSAEAQLASSLRCQPDICYARSCVHRRHLHESTRQGKRPSTRESTTIWLGAILTESEASPWVGTGWRYLLDCLLLSGSTPSSTRARSSALRSTSAKPHANDHLRLRATPDQWNSPLETRVAHLSDYAGRRSIATLSTKNSSHDQVTRRSSTSCSSFSSSLAIAIDAMDIPTSAPVLEEAMLGYDAVTAPADLVDPSYGGPSLWFQQMDDRAPVPAELSRPPAIPHHDDAVARVETALHA